MHQLLRGRQLPGLGGKPFCQRQALSKAERLGGVQQFFRAQLLPQADKIAVAAFFQRSGKVYLPMWHPARAAEDLPIHHHRAGALENRLQARFQCSRRQHRLEHRAHRIALQRPVQEGAVRRLQTVGKVLRVVARHTDAGAHRRRGGIQHQNAAALHSGGRHRFHRPLHRTGDGQLHTQRPAVGLQKFGRLAGAQRTLRCDGADKAAVLPWAGKHGVQCLFQPRSAVTCAIQIAQQMLTQRLCGIPPGGGVTGQSKAGGVAVHLQQKRRSAAAAAVQKRLPGGVRAGIQPVVIALPGKTHHLPALL